MRNILQRLAILTLILSISQLCLFSESKAMSRNLDTARVVYYSCSATGNPNAEQILCHAVEDYMKANNHNAQKALMDNRDGLHLEFILDVVAKAHLTGRMNWTRCSAGDCSKPVKGADVEVFVMDAQVSERSYQSLVNGLFKVSKPPL